MSCLTNVLDQLDDTVKEARLQTERERQLELQLIAIIRRLQDVTVQATDKQKKLDEVRRQATDKLKSDQYVINKKCAKEIFQHTEQAKLQLVELKQLRQEEEQILCECKNACQTFLHTGVLAGHDIAKISQEDASARVNTLSSDSRIEVSKYRNEIRMISESIVVNETVRKALDRENKLHHELNLSKERREKLEDDMKESLEKMAAFDDEIRQSVARQNQFQSLINDMESKIEQARIVAYFAQQALQTEQLSEENQEKKLQEDLYMTSERIKTIKQEILQADKRKQWLNKLESSCGKESSAHELFQQTSAERNLLKEQLQRGLQSEEELLQQLQQMHDNKKLSKNKLEMTSECLKNTWEKINQESERMNQTCLIFENEEMLQKHLKETKFKSSGVHEEIERALSEEKKNQQKLREMSEEECVFRLPLTQLKYSRSGNCSLFSICRNYSKHL